MIRPGVFTLPINPRFNRFLLLICVFAFASFGRAQLLPPPGGSNWVLESVTKQGHIYGHSYGFIMGVPTPIPFDVPLGSETGGPQATNTTGLPHFVEATCEGKVTWRFRWQGLGQPPARIMVKRDSFVMASFGSSGSASADNGLGCPEEWWGNTVVSTGSRKKIYNSSSGVFDVEIEFKSDVDGSESAQVGQSCSVTLLPRHLSTGIVGHEANYRKRFNGQMVSSSGGSYPKAVPELVLPEENNQGEMHHVVKVAVPITTRAYYNYAHPYTHIDANAYAIGDHEPTEYFQWFTPMDNTSGSLPGWGGSDYTFGDAGVTNFFWACREDDNSVTPNGVYTSADAGITYTWSDGFSLTSRTTVEAVYRHEKPTLFHSINFTQDGQLTWQLNSFGVLESDPGWTDVNQTSLRCILRKKDALINAAGVTLQFVFGVGAEFSPIAPVKLACIAAGIGLNLVMPEDDPQWFGESLDEFQAAIARTPTEGLWVDEIPDEVTLETMRQYQWRVRVLPLYMRDFYYADQYGDHGFEGQVEDMVKWQNSVRYGYQFELRQGPGIQ